jgi:hypothetical protein
MIDELIGDILSTGTRVVVKDEPVKGGLTRPLVVHYVSAKGVVAETWSYPNNSAMTDHWGAINGVGYSLVSGPIDPTLLKVKKDKAFGVQLIEEFLAMRKDVDSTPEENLALFSYSYLGDVRDLLYEGSIKSAMLQLQKKDEKVIPAQVRDLFVEKMQQYLDYGS